MIIPKNSQDIEGIRGFLDGLKQQTCSLAQIYQGPLKEMLSELQGKIKTALAALPTGEVKNDWKVDDTLQCLCACLAGASGVASQLGLELNRLTQTQASLVTTEVERMIGAGELFRKDAMEAQVEGTLKAKTEAGELVPKDLVAQLCSEAKVNGANEGRAALQAELDAQEAAERVAGERRAALTAAGKPLPPAQVEEVLRRSQEEFDAAQAKFDTRVQALTEAGFRLSPELQAKAWLGDDAYAVFEATVKDIPALKGAAQEPFAGGTGGGDDKPRLTRLL